MLQFNDLTKLLFMQIGQMEYYSHFHNIFEMQILIEIQNLMILRCVANVKWHIHSKASDFKPN